MRTPRDRPRRIHRRGEVAGFSRQPYGLGAHPAIHGRIQRDLGRERRKRHVRVDLHLTGTRLVTQHGLQHIIAGELRGDVLRRRRVVVVARGRTLDRQLQGVSRQRRRLRERRVTVTLGGERIHEQAALHGVVAGVDVRNQVQLRDHFR